MFPQGFAKMQGSVAPPRSPYPTYVYPNNPTNYNVGNTAVLMCTWCEWSVIKYYIDNIEYIIGYIIRCTTSPSIIITYNTVHRIVLLICGTLRNVINGQYCKAHALGDGFSSITGTLYLLLLMHRRDAYRWLTTARLPIGLIQPVNN